MNQQDDRIVEIHSRLMHAAANDIVGIPESFFVSYFLPYFAGKELVAYSDKIDRWISLAGSHFKPMHVFDDKTKAILYTVPPLFDMDAVGVSNKKNGSIASMLMTMSQLSAIHPSQGTKYFADYINKLEILHDRKAEALAQTRVWLEIFKRYKMIPLDFNLPADVLAEQANAQTSEQVKAIKQINFDDVDML